MTHTDTTTMATSPSGSAQHGGLVTDHGRTTIADSVVEKIAGIAAREVSGVHEMGGGAARAFGNLKETLPGSAATPSPTQGVTVEVGERQAAIDLELVVEYGVAISDLAEAVRRNVIGRVERMTGLEVTEVNITVDDVFLGDDKSEQPDRVQ